MTVIAWDGKTLAADGLMTYGDSIGSTRQQKIFRADDFLLSEWNLLGHRVLVFAITGIIGCEQHLISALNDSLHQDVEFPSHLNFTAFLVLDNAETWLCSKNGDKTGVSLYRVEMDQFALGCGSDAALGAMLGGRNAIDAVAIAMDVNVYCGGEIQQWTPIVSHPSGNTVFATNPNQEHWINDEATYANS